MIVLVDNHLENGVQLVLISQVNIYVKP